MFSNVRVVLSLYSSDDDGGSDSSVSDGLPVNIAYIQNQVGYAEIDLVEIFACSFLHTD